MSTEYINPQWRLPNYKTGNNQDYSMSFDSAVNNYIEIGATNSFDFNTGNFSISFWMNKTSGSGAYQSLIDISGHDIGPPYTDGTVLYSNTANKIHIFNREGGSWQSTITTASGWNHICLVRNGANLDLYINNSGGQNSESLATNVSSTNFGGNRVSRIANGNDFNGKIDAVSIYNYALPATGSNSVATLYNSGNPFNPMALSSPPIAYYPLGNAAHMGTNYLTPNGALQDYVFKIQPGNGIDTGIINLGYQFTVSFWFQRTVTGEYRLLNVTNSAGASSNKYLVDIVYPGSNQVFSHITDTSSFQSIVDSNIPLNSWIHCAYTRNGRDSNIYLSYNGAFNQNSGSNSMQFPASEATTNTYIANLIQSIPGDGFLSNVNYFTSILTLSEIETLYNYGSPIQTLANIPQSSNLKAWYKLDASDVYDSSNTQWQIANNVLSDKAYSFNGTNNIEITQNSSIQTSSFSIGAWIKGYPQDNKIIIENGGTSGFYLYTATNGRVYCKVGGGVAGVTQAGALNGEWNFVWFTFAGLPRAALNGAYNSGGGGSGNTPNYDSSKGLFIGSKSDSSNGFVGEIAQVVYYDGRGSNNAAGIYGTVPTNPPASTSSTANLVSWWKLDAASITDSNGSNNGTNNGATLIDTNVGRISAVAGLSSGMNQSNLVQSDLLTTSSYSPYALAFDGNDYIDIGTGGISTISSSLSIWFKTTSTAANKGFFGINSNSVDYYISLLQMGGTGALQFWDGSAYTYITPVINDGNWHNLVVTYDHGASLFKAYTDGAETYSATYSQASGMVFKVIGSTYGINRRWVGDLSNASLWSQALTFSQVREIYNQGLPSDLNSHSAVSLLTGWWQLGSNSSFASNWTVLDEIGTNNGTSTGMLENAIVDGVGTSANGTSTNMGTATNISGSSPNGEANSLSVNMTLANIADGVN